MNCKRARTEIALWAGDDLDEQIAGPLKRHVAICAECREYRRQMVSSVHVLQEPQRPRAAKLHDSVWPGLAGRLPSPDETRRGDRLNRWLPAVAVAVACLAVIAFTSEADPRRQDLNGGLISADLFDFQSVSEGGPPVSVHGDSPWGAFRSIDNEPVYLVRPSDQNRRTFKNRDKPDSLPTN